MSEEAHQEAQSLKMPETLLSAGHGVIGHSMPQNASSMWLITFTDMMALMLTFFVLLYAMSAPEQEQWSEMTSALQGELREYEPPKWYSGDQDSIDIRKIDFTDGLNLDYLASLLTAVIADDEKLSNIKILQPEDHIIIALPQDLVFAKGQVEINEDGQRALYLLGGVLSKIRNRIEVVGHTDPDPIEFQAGRFASNWELSIARASAVTGALANAGYDKPMRIRGMSSARYDELPKNLEEDERLALARRVDIAIYKDDGGTRGFLMLGGGL